MPLSPEMEAIVRGGSATTTRRRRTLSPEMEAIVRGGRDRPGSIEDEARESIFRRGWDTLTQPIKSAVGVTGTIGGAALAKGQELLGGDPELYGRAHRRILGEFGFDDPETAPLSKRLEALPGAGDVFAEAVPEAWRESLPGRILEPVGRIAGNIAGDPTSLLGGPAIRAATGGVTGAGRALRAVGRVQGLGKQAALVGRAAKRAGTAAAALPATSAAGVAYLPEIVETTAGAAMEAYRRFREGDFAGAAEYAAQAGLTGGLGGLVGRGVAADVGEIAARRARTGPAVDDSLEAAARERSLEFQPREIEDADPIDFGEAEPLGNVWGGEAPREFTPREPAIDPLDVRFRPDLEEAGVNREQARLARLDRLQRAPEQEARMPVQELARIKADQLDAVEIGAKRLSMERARENLRAGKEFPVRILERADGTRQIIDGRHTLRAAGELGIRELPVEIQREPTETSPLVRPGRQRNEAIAARRPEPTTLPMSDEMRAVLNDLGDYEAPRLEDRPDLRLARPEHPLPRQAEIPWKAEARDASEVVVEVDPYEVFRAAQGDILRPGRARQEVPGGDKLTRAADFLSGAEGRGIRVEVPELGIDPDGRLEIADGFHRMMAAAELGHDRVPVVVSRESVPYLRELGVEFASDAESPVRPRRPQGEAAARPAAPEQPRVAEIPRGSVEAGPGRAPAPEADLGQDLDLDLGTLTEGRRPVPARGAELVAAAAEPELVIDARGRTRTARAAPERLPKLAEIPRDDAGNRILPGQEDWTPAQRQATHEAAESWVAHVDSMERGEPTGRRPVLGGPGGRDVQGYYGVGSKKVGTPLEDLPYSPGEMKRALKRDRGNAVERDVHEAVYNRDPQIDDYADSIERGDVEGDVDFDYGANVEGEDVVAPRYATEKRTYDVGDPDAPDYYPVRQDDGSVEWYRRLYRGASRPDPSTVGLRPGEEGRWFTADREHAARFGPVESIDIPAREAQTYRVMGDKRPGAGHFLVPERNARFATQKTKAGEQHLIPGALGGRARREFDPSIGEGPLFNQERVRQEAREARAQRNLFDDEETPPPDRERFAAAPEPASGAVDDAAVRRAFPKQRVEAVGEGEWVVTLPGDRRIRVRQDGEIALDPEAFRAGYDRAAEQGERAVGAYSRIGPEALIRLAKEGGTEGTLRHETFHAAMDLALTPRETKAILKRFGSEEAAARAFESWTPRQGGNSLFAKIAAFFRRIWQSLRPSAESAFGRVRSGEAFGSTREAGGEGGGAYSNVAAPFHSAVARALDSQKAPVSARGESFEAWLKKQPGVKPEEMQWTGLDDYLRERRRQKVTRAEVQEYMRQNQVSIEETTLGGVEGERVKAEYDRATETAQAANRDFARYRDEFSQRDYANVQLARDTQAAQALREGKIGSPDALRSAEKLWDAQEALGSTPEPGASRTKFGSASLQLPGGKNYREVLLRLPARKETFEEFVRRSWPTARRSGTGPPESLMRELYDGRGTPGQAAPQAAGFRGGHFDEPNVLAHLRLNDRTDADGKRVLFVEEIQSDWHQKGRKQGYQGQLRDADLVAEMVSDASGTRYYEVRTREGRPVTNVTSQDVSVLDQAHAIAEAQRRLRDAPRRTTEGSAVPDAPLKKTWHEMAFRRALKMAADEGYDRVAWTTGEQQAARYDLSKQVDAIQVKKTGEQGPYSVIARKDGAEVLARHGLESTALDELIGKELADKARQQEAAVHVYSGVDLKVGGEGMKGFYDKILPDYARKFGKKFGAKVGEARLPSAQEGVGRGDDGAWEVYDPRDGVPVETFATEAEARSFVLDNADRYLDFGRADDIPTVHSIDITPQMRETARTEGFPLFATQRTPVEPEPRRPFPDEQSPRVEGRVDEIDAAERATGFPRKALDRETRRTWDDIEPEVKRTLREWDEDRFYETMAKRRLQDHEVQAWDAVVKGKLERREKLREGLGIQPSAKAQREYVAASLDFIRAQRANVQDGTGAARALAARRKIMESAYAARPGFFKAVDKHFTRIVERMKQLKDLVVDCG